MNSEKLRYVDTTEARGGAVECRAAPPKRIGRIAFVVTGLECGGAEMMLLRLLSHLDRSAVSPVVISLHGAGSLSADLSDLGVPVHELDWKRPIHTPRAARALMSAISSVEPDLIQGWMMHGSLAAHLANLASRRRVPVLWNMRHSLHDVEYERVTTKTVIRLLRFLSPASARIIYNSHVVARQHERLGFDSSRTVVIPNGFDCDRFRPRLECRATARAALDIPASAPLIGLIARVHPTKDHRNFFDAAKRLVAKGCPAHFVLVGRGTDGPAIADQIAVRSLGGRVHTLGERTDTPEIMAALDLATSSSRAEAFPNVVGEAMACGVPCVVTDVGDSARLVGETGRVVPRTDPIALSDAWLELLSLPPHARERMGHAARHRIVTHFSVQGVIARYESLYREFLDE